MIDNRDLYLFEETDETTQPEASDSETEFQNTEPGPPKFLYQSVVATLCLVITMLLCRNEQGWVYWARERLHYAINASSQNTFGVLWRSPLFQTLVWNGKNFIRLEKITQTMSSQGRFREGDSPVFEDSVWPVPGNIIREFEGNGLIGTFNSGVIMETSDQAMVIAVTAGIVAQVKQNTGGWVIEIDHGSGWRSIYQPITQVQVHQAQPVKTGQIIGRLKTGNDMKNRLFFEVYQNGKPVNPRTVIR